MLTTLYVLSMTVIFGRLTYYSIKFTWGMAKVLFTLIFLPLILLYSLFEGLIHLTFPLLIIIGLISFLKVR